MKVFDLFYLSFQNFKNRKSRTLLTILGVAVGIGAILFLVSLGYGLQHMLLERITTEESLLTFDIVSPDPELIVLDRETLNQVAKIENVERVSPQAFFPGQVSLGEFTSEATINLIEPDFFILGGILPQLGRVFEVEERQKMVVNSSVAELFNLQPAEILGKKLGLLIFLPEEDVEGVGGIEVFKTEKKFEVVGVIEEVGAPAEVYLNRADLPELPIKEYQLAKVKVVDDQAMESVRESLIGVGFMVSALSDVIAQANRIFRVIQIVLGIFGVIALIVSAIGLLNTMTISLLERTSEIGIMRAIGASAGDIKRLFLIESFIIGFLGGVAGIGVGILAAEVFNSGVNILAMTLGAPAVDLFVYPVWFIIFIIILSSLVGLGAGFWPAKRAAKLNPLEALRYK
ncbi:ABC transporter permease [Dehalococcoidia bacterium]|nr:ABC transporter permease [Dehalococcoidia bacterium]